MYVTLPVSKNFFTFTLYLRDKPTETFTTTTTTNNNTANSRHEAEAPMLWSFAISRCDGLSFCCCLSLFLHLLVHVEIAGYWAQMEAPSLESFLHFRQGFNQKPMVDRLTEHHSYERELKTIKTYYPTGRVSELVSKALTSLPVCKHIRVWPWRASFRMHHRLLCGVLLHNRKDCLFVDEHIRVTA